MMGFSYEERSTDSPFIETIWRTFSEMSSCYTALADGSWDILVLRQKSETKILVAGPNTKATPIIYEADTEKLGIRFKVGTFMPQLPLCSLVNSIVVLPNATRHSFWLGDVAWEFPDFENVEAFVEGLERNNLITRNPLVEAVLEEQEPSLSHRSVQRHFLKTTGLTFKTIRQIERARTATELLKHGVSIQDIVHRLGYNDQPHLTKALKRFIGQTPAQLQKL